MFEDNEIWLTSLIDGRQYIMSFFILVKSELGIVLILMKFLEK
jgi:hypothetical protein